MKLLDTFVRTPVSEALGWSLFHSLWEGLVIATMLAALLTVVRSPRLRYLAGCIALLAMVVSTVVTLIQFLPGGDSNAQAVTQVIAPAGNEVFALSRTASNRPDFALLIPWLAPFWLTGVCIFYLRYAMGWFSLRRLRRRGVCTAPESWQQAVHRLANQLRMKRPVILIESLLADTPVVLGHFRPVILVPLGFLVGLPSEQVEAVLLHELAHIRRADYLVNIGQRLIEGFLFYHPAVWWISRVIRTEREHCCDDIVVNLRGDAHGYANALTALEHNRHHKQWPTGEPAVAATGGDLMKRVRRLLYPGSQSGVWAPALTAIVLLATTATVLMAWQAGHAVSAAEQPNSKLSGPWGKWLNEDVVYLISKDERAAFERLQTDEERQTFVEQFWVRRDPTPGTPENEFKEEHYRRIAYANSHYAASQIPGWKTDRGRIYIMYGPPDEIESHPVGGSYERPEIEGGGLANTYPFEGWRYHRFQGVGNLAVEFVDPTGSQEFRLALDPKDKYKKP